LRLAFVLAYRLRLVSETRPASLATRRRATTRWLWCVVVIMLVFAVRRLYSAPRVRSRGPAVPGQQRGLIGWLAALRRRCSSIDTEPPRLMLIYWAFCRSLVWITRVMLDALCARRTGAGAT
jgi:hypothetical protein